MSSITSTDMSWARPEASTAFLSGASLVSVRALNSTPAASDFTGSAASAKILPAISLPLSARSSSSESA